jgi:hypothetical protein
MAMPVELPPPYAKSVPEEVGSLDPKELALAYGTLAAAYHHQWPAVQAELRKNADERLVVRDWMRAVEARLTMIDRRVAGRAFDRWVLVAAALVVVADVALRVWGR